MRMLDAVLARHFDRRITYEIVLQIYDEAYVGWHLVQ